MRKLLLLAMALLLFSGCTNDEYDDDGHSPYLIRDLERNWEEEQQQEQARAADAAIAAADRLASQFLELARQGDSAALLAFLRDAAGEYYSRLDEPAAARFLKLLAYEAEPSTLVAMRYAAASNEAQEAYLVSGVRAGEEVTLREPLYVLLKPPGLRWSYLASLPYMEETASRYVELIRAGEPQALAGFMEAAGRPYTEQDAAKLMNMYRLYFDDASELALAYAGDFGFMVSAGGAERHYFRLIPGDGSLEIEDAFAPLP